MGIPAEAPRDHRRPGICLSALPVPQRPDRRAADRCRRALPGLPTNAPDRGRLGTGGQHSRVLRLPDDLPPRPRPAGGRLRCLYRWIPRQAAGDSGASIPDLLVRPRASAILETGRGQSPAAVAAETVADHDRELARRGGGDRLSLLSLSAALASARRPRLSVAEISPGDRAAQQLLRLQLLGAAGHRAALQCRGLRWSACSGPTFWG